MPLNNQSFLTLPRGLIRVAGADRSEFLQGLVSNDMAGLTHDNALYACLLSPQGKFLHDFFIVDEGDAFVIDCEPGARRDDLIKRLNIYKLRRSAEIAVIEDRVVVVGLGPLPAMDNAKIFADPRHTDMGWRAIVSSDVTSTGDLNFVDWDYQRISLTIPDGSRDAEIGASTLEELNITRLNGVSFTKGCYVGQELTARMHNRNAGKRHLKTVKLGEIPAGAELRSSCRDIGLALIRDHLP